MNYIIKAPENIMKTKSYYEHINHLDLTKEEPSIQKFLTARTPRDEWKKSLALDTNNIRNNVIYRLPTPEGLMPIFKILHFEPTKNTKALLDALISVERYK